MKNRHLYPLLSIFSVVILLVLLSVTPIPVSPMMITVLVVASFVGGITYHLHKNTISNEKVVELALLAFIVQIAAISFL